MNPSMLWPLRMLRSALPPLIVACSVTSISVTAVAQSAAPAPEARVSIDPVTRQIRPVENDEARALERDAQQRARASRATATGTFNREFRGPGGSVGMTLDDSTHSHVMARRGADGKVRTQCDATASASPPSAGVTNASARGSDAK